MWRIENFQQVEVEEEAHGRFHEGDCYIVFYTYKEPGKNYEKYLIYYWLVSSKKPLQ